MDSQLHDQWNAVVEADTTDDRLLQARLRVELARLLLEEASNLKDLGTHPDSRAMRVLSQWAQAAALVANYLPPVVARLQERLAAFKADILTHTPAVAKAAQQLEEAQTAFEHLRPAYEALSTREAELRHQQALLAGLNAHYQELTALDAHIAPELADLSVRQGALTALWSVLAQASHHLSAQRDLLHTHVQANQTLTEAIEWQNRLLEQAPSEATMAAISQISAVQQALEQLDKSLDQARQSEQAQLERQRREHL